MEILKTMRAAGHDLACVTTGSKQNATEVLEHFRVTPADTMIFEDSGIGLTAAKASGARVFRVERF